jgi:hypothetical protein
VTVSVALRVAPRVAEIVTFLFDVVARVAIEKETELEPGGTETLEGTVAIPILLLESVTSVPAAGAGPFSVIVPVEEIPPRTEVGLRERELSIAAVTVKFAVLAVLP